VRTFTTTLGGKDVTVFAPEPGTFNPDAFRLYFPQGGLYGLDMESTELGDQGVFAPDWRLRLVQFGTDGYAWVLDVDRDPVQREAAVKLLSDPTCTFASHTTIDPLAVHVGLGVDIADRYLDTFWLSMMTSGHDVAGRDLKEQTTRHIGPELARADRVLSERFCDLYNAAHPYRLGEDGQPKMTKGTAKEPPRPYKATPLKPSPKTGKAPDKVAAYGFTNVSADDPAYLTYAGLDAVAVRRVAPRLVEATRAPASLLSTERWLSGQSVRVTARGHRIDVDRLHALRTETEAVTGQAEAELLEMTDGIGPRQNAKLVDFFSAHGATWRGYPRTDSGAPSLSKKHAALLLAEPMDAEGRAAARKMLDYADRLNRLTVSQQLLDRIVTVNGITRIHGQVNTIGTVTGRMSSSGGVNMQNFSKKDRVMRGLFLPEPGHVLMSCDFAQIELRVLAALAGEIAMIETILAGGDLHTLTAELLDIARQAAKTVNFLIVYGGGGRKLAGQLGFPEGMDPEEWISTCYETVRTYWSKYPAITEYKAWAEQQDELELISGRKVPVDPDRAYANLNYMIQGSARELLAGAWQRFGVDYGRADFMWMPIHDELVLQVPEHLAERVATEVTSCMTFDFLGVPVAADPDVLLDEDGVSRWMPGDVAKGIRLAKECAARGGHTEPNHKDECTHCETKIKELIAA
jgi:DNA polymerase I-like protein with 3'-5' exonuclease and polymerase domains